MLHALGLLVCVSAVTGCATPPWSEPGLSRVSDPAYWASGQVPTSPFTSTVTITKNTLFDATLPAFTQGIVISPGVKVVFDPNVKVKVETAFVEVRGEMVVGSAACPYTGDLEIELLGKKGELPDRAGMGQKVIGVAAGGALELHGAPQLAWTKLSATVNKLTPSNGLLYDLESGPDKNTDRWRVGIMMQVLDSSGSHVHYEGFTFGDADWAFWSIRDFIDRIKAVATGHYVILTSRRSIGRVDALPMPDNFGEAVDEVEKLLSGSVDNLSALRSIGTYDAYVAVAKKGDTSLSTETVGAYDATTNPSPELTIKRNILNNFILTAHTKHDITDAWDSDVTIRTVTYDAAYPVINVIDDVTSWKTGDKVLLLSTDYDFEQAEEATIVDCPTCSSSQIRIDLELLFTHWGSLVDGVDERGEVALLSRNIKIHGRMEDACPSENANCGSYAYDTFGGHIIVLKGFASANVEHVELYHMGQQMIVGRYPIHYHMCEDVDSVGGYSSSPVVRGNSIHDSFSRCVTCHGTHGLHIIDNVAWNHLGHCYFLEDGGEKRNVLEGNLGGGTRQATLIPSDSDPSTFWITNPLNELRDNVAAGGEHNGYWYIFPEEPTGASSGKGYMSPGEACRTPLTQFLNNVAHSYDERGLMVDGTLQPDLTVDGVNCWRPVVDVTDEDSAPAPNVFRQYTGYKNRNMNFWIRGGECHVIQASLADSPAGGIFAALGHGAQFIKSSVVVGETANLGEPSRWWDDALDDYAYHYRSLAYVWDRNRPVQGIRYYDGPVHVQHTWFSRFSSDAHREAGALGWLRNNHFSISPINSAWDIRFGFSDTSEGNRVYDNNATGDPVHFGDNDGDVIGSFHDDDGSVTATADTQVVRNRPFLVTPQCAVRGNWNRAVCPGQMAGIVLKLYAHEGGPRLDNTYTRARMSRDDPPHVTEQVDGENMNQWLVHKHLSYVTHWVTKSPPHMKFYVRALQQDEGMRLGICLPANAVFTVRVGQWGPGDYVTPTRVYSIEEVVADTYFYDDALHVLFVRPTNQLPLAAGEPCPDTHNCASVSVTVTSGDPSTAFCTPYPTYQTAAPTSDGQVVIPATLPTSSLAAPDGWGAGSTRPFTSRAVTSGGWTAWSGYSKCSVTCGDGVQIRVRECSNPLPSNGGANCVGNAVETQPCNLGNCPVHGGWGSWASTSGCLVPQGDSCAGVIVKQRACDNPAPLYGGSPCSGQPLDLRPCVCCTCTRVVGTYSLNTVIFT